MTTLLSNSTTPTMHAEGQSDSNPELNDQRLPKCSPNACTKQVAQLTGHDAVKHVCPQVSSMLGDGGQRVEGRNVAPPRAPPL